MDYSSIISNLNLPNLVLGGLSNNDGNGNENVTWK